MPDVCFYSPPPPPSRQTNELHKNNFDFVRLVAAFCVIVSHQFALTGLGEPSVLSVHSVGGFGVLLFFSISGYLVAMSWDADPNAFRFLLKRFLRIWPGLATVILLAALVLGPIVTELSLHDYFRHPYFVDYLNNLRFGLRDQLPMSFVGNPLPYPVNGSLWTIPIEVKCYALLGLLGVIGVVKRRRVITAIALLIVVAYAVIEPRGDRIVNALNWRLDQRFALEFSLFFFAGVLLHKLHFNSTPKRQRTILILCWVGALVAYGTHRPFLALWLVVPITTLVVGTASTPYLRHAGRFGDVSYGMYLYAFPVQQTLIWLYRGKLSWLTILCLASVSTLCLAFASWHLVEKRMLRLKPNRSTMINVSNIVPICVMTYVVFR